MRSVHSTPWWVASLGLCAACALTNDPGTQIGVETSFGCDYDVESLADSSTAPSGFSSSLDSLLPPALGEFAGLFAFEDDTEQGIEVLVTQSGDPEVWRPKPTSSGGEQPTIQPEGPGCTPTYAVPVVIEFTSGSLFDESFESFVTFDDSEQGAFYARVDFDDLVGDAEPTTFDPSQMAAVDVDFSGELAEWGWYGGVGFGGESEPSGTGPEASVSYTMSPLGTYEVEPVP